jgi:hypothetical protein
MELQETEGSIAVDAAESFCLPPDGTLIMGSRIEV